MKTYYLLINILLLSAVCASCSKEEGGNTPEPELPATPKLSIELNSRDIATKAEDDYTPTKELEGIYDYYIYVVDATTNQVEAAVSGTAQSVDKVSVDDIEVEEGKKYVFAFANLKRIESDPVITKILNLKEGVSADEILSNDQRTQAVSFFAGEETNPLLVDGTHHIPMSALMDSTEVSAKERGHVELDLYRMFAKIEFEFTNKYEGEVVIEKIEMDGFQNGNVYLMPHKFFPAMEAKMEEDGSGNYEAQNSRDYAPFLPDGSYGEIVQPIVLNGKTITLDAAPKKTEGSTPTYPKSSDHIYYVNETDLATTREQTPSTRFQISLLMTMGDEKVTKPISLPDHSYIRRNDHMIIPITISDYTFELAVGNSRAPIGGYPKYMQAGVADDFTCTLEYAGKTELFFNLRDVTEKLVEGLTEKDYDLTLVDDPNGLIAKDSDGQPDLTLESVGDGTGTITTTITNAYGTAILSLKIKLLDRILSYIIYLVRERENTGN